MAVTTIQIQTETRNLLKRISAKGETYDDVIREMAAAYQAYLTEQLRKLDEDEFIPAEEVFRTDSSEKPHALQPWDESRAEG